MIDQVDIHVKAGKGGDGKVSFLRLKFQPKGGPDGGDGGRGGSVYIVGDKDLNTLRHFLGAKKYKAEDGGAGGKKLCHGGNGADYEVKVPVGTIIHDVCEIMKDGQKVRVAQGGEGGLGNDHFKSGIRTTPMFAQPGEPGGERDLRLELKLLANIGLVGFPNAGKSTLLSVITKAKPEIANYPFTTLTPNLGVISDIPDGRTLVVADIPGLIEGASEGKGLGHDFLRHIERCTILVYVLSLEDQEAGDVALTAVERAKKLFTQMVTLQAELRAYNPSILEKQAIVFLNKTDLYPPETSSEAVIQAFTELEKTAATPEMPQVVLAGSAGSTLGITELKNMLTELTVPPESPVEEDIPKKRGNKFRD